MNLFSQERLREYLSSTGWPKARCEQWLREQNEAVLDLEAGKTDGPFEHTLFSKDEPYPTGKPPRNIANALPHLKALGALSLFKLNEHFFKQDFTVKHFSSERKKEVLRDKIKGHATYFVTDHSAFECSMNRQIYLATEDIVYSKCVPHATLLREVLGRKSRVYRTYGATVKIPSIRSSGDYNTSMGNTLVNYLSIKAVAEQLGCKVDCVVEGDDALIGITPRVEPEEFKAAMGRFGFNIKIEEYDDPGRAGFCSIYWDEDAVLYKPLKKRLQKMMWGKPDTALHPKELLNAKVASAFAETPRDPVMCHLHKLANSKYGALPYATWSMEAHPEGFRKGNFWMYAIKAQAEPMDLVKYAELQGLALSDLQIVLSAETFEGAWWKAATLLFQSHPSVKVEPESLERLRYRSCGCP